MFTLPGKSQKCWCVILLLLSIATAGSAQEKKRAVPDEVALTKATGLIREMYKDEFEQATSAAAQMKLARQLAEKARVMNDDPAACYALLREAGSLAYKADAFPVMLKVIDEINERYVVDAWDLRSKALSAASDRNGKWDGDLRYRLGLQLAV